jgi:hypothetical protein
MHRCRTRRLGQGRWLMGTPELVIVLISIAIIVALVWVEHSRR